MSVGNVFTWPTPQQGGGDFTSRAAELWYRWGESGRDDEQQWYNQFQTFANQSTWQNAINEQYFDDSLYSFTTNPFDPYKAVTGYTPKSNLAFARIMGDIGAWIEREHPELSWFGQNGATVGSGSMANLGGAWSGVDQWNEEILQAQNQVMEKTGVWVPGNVIKAIMKIESDGQMLPPNYAGYYGLMQVGPGSWGVGTDWDPNRAMTDPAYNIFAGTMELARRYNDAMSKNPAYTWANVAVGYFSGGYDIQPGGDRWTSIQQYHDAFVRYLAELDAGVQGNWGGSTGGTVGQILAEAQKYVGVQYVWGAIPGRGQDPWETGWDCSGFTYWLDQTYGTGQLPQGSHYQYEYARNSGRLFTDQSQLMPGDLLFFNTYSRGGGSHLNAAGHVGIYLGDGKMISALNPSQGTLITGIDQASVGGPFIGAMHMGWSGPGGSTGGGTSSFLAVTGGLPFPVTQEFGPTDWSTGEGAWMYRYAVGLGMEGHPALDIGTPTGTKLFAGVSGTVVIDGGTGVYALEGQEYVPYTGHLQIELDNGDMVVYGHMYQIDVRVGQRVDVNTPIGLSGYYNGPHLHLEYWLNKPHANGAYTAADPRIAMSGQVSGQFQPGMGDMQFRAGADNWAAFMRATATGQPVMGYTAGNSGGSFHNWMKQGLLNGWAGPSGTGGTTGAWTPGQNTVAGAWGVSFTPDIWSNIQNLSNARS